MQIFRSIENSTVVVTRVFLGTKCSVTEMSLIHWIHSEQSSKKFFFTWIKSGRTWCCWMFSRDKMSHRVEWLNWICVYGKYKRLTVSRRSHNLVGNVNCAYTVWYIADIRPTVVLYLTCMNLPLCRWLSCWFWVLLMCLRWMHLYPHGIIKYGRRCQLLHFVVTDFQDWQCVIIVDQFIWQIIWYDLKVALCECRCLYQLWKTLVGQLFWWTRWRWKETLSIFPYVFLHASLISVLVARLVEQWHSRFKHMTFRAFEKHFLKENEGVSELMSLRGSVMMSVYVLNLFKHDKNAKMHKQFNLLMRISDLPYRPISE